MLETYKPDIGELGFRQGLMADPETMSYNAAWGGTIPFPQEDWQDVRRPGIHDVLPVPV